MNTAFEDEIRQRAYAIWVAAGKNEGDAESHWFHAEHVVRTEAEATVVSTAAAKGKAKPARAAAGASKAPAAKTVTKAATPKALAAKGPATKAPATETAAARRPKAGPIEAVA